MRTGLRALSCFLLAGLPVAVLAQTYEQVAPLQPDIPAAAPVKLSELVPLVENDTPVLQELKGLLLLSEQSDFDPAGREGVSGLVIRSDSKQLNHPDLPPRLLPFLGKPLALQDLSKISREIAMHYRELGWPVVDPLVPGQQDITSGTVQIVVIEGRFAKAKVEGNEYFDTEHLASQLSLEPGDLVSLRQLSEDSQWLNNHPFRKVELLLNKGEQIGEVDVVLRVEDRLPLRVFTSLDNQGSNTSGDWRWLTGINYGNLFGLDQQLSYQFTTAKDLELTRSHSGTWIIPLPWRHNLVLFGSHSRSRPDLGEEISFAAESWQLGGRYRFPLPHVWEPLAHELTLGADFKQTNNNLELGGESVFASFVDIAQISAGWTGQLSDPYGTTIISTTAVFSPGDLTEQNKNTAFEQARAGAEAAYHYFQGSMTRITPLPGDFRWSLTARGQWTDQALLSNEQFSIGGNGSIRGYEESEATGDRGYLLTTELSTPSMPIPWIGRFQFIGFVDYGAVRDNERLPDAVRETALFSAGPGFRLRGDHLQCSLDYGVQLRNRQLDDRLDSRLHLSVTLSY